MILKNILLSLSAGTLTGYIYGLLFLHTRSGALSLASFVFFNFLRFALLFGAGIYLLALPSIQPIILVLSFLATFWLVILMQKAPFNERRRIFKR